MLPAGRRSVTRGAPSRRHRLYVAGDSTACVYAKDEAPRTGWGQALDPLVRIPVDDRAMPGRSSKSFVDEGRLATILGIIRPGDRLLISFGHNDEKKDDSRRYTEPWTTYQQYLRMYVDGARAHGARPVLVTAVERRRFSAGGRPEHTHGDYPAAMRDLARQTRTPLVDLAAMSFALWRRLGPERTKDYFLWLDPGDSPDHPDGRRDNTHFQAHGAIELARLICADLARRRILPPREVRDRAATIPDSAIRYPDQRPV